MTAPAVDEQVRAALRERSLPGLAAALRTGAFLLAVVEGAGTTVPAVLTSAQGVRSLAVFSGPDAARSFGGVDRVRGVPGTELLHQAHLQRVDTVLLDPAGPHPAELPVADLQALADGLLPGGDDELRAQGSFEVGLAAPPAALVEAVQGVADATGWELWLFERTGASGPVLTVGVDGDHEQAGRVASVLGGIDGLPAVDVVQLPDSARGALDALGPGARVAPASGAGGC